MNIADKTASTSRGPNLLAAWRSARNVIGFGRARPNADAPSSEGAVEPAA